MGSAAPLPRWHLWLDETPRPGWANMAIDEALLDRAEEESESWLRLYQWEPHCLSFGRHEPAARRYDVGRIAALGMDTVRRPTGGRAVWHGRELTYAVAAPNLRLGSLQAAYHEIHRMLGDALRALGAPVSFAPWGRTSPLDAGACFSHPVGGEIMVGGQKVVGSAQFRHGNALLQHGSILLDDDQQAVVRVTRGANDNRPNSSEKSSTAPFTRTLGRVLGGAEVAEAVASAAAARWPGSWSRASQPDQVMRTASRHFTRYRSSAWTWAR